MAQALESNAAMTTTEITKGLQFPEGPVWMPDGTVLCVELKRGTVDRVHPDGTIETIAEPGGSPNGLAIGPDGAV
jgi:gluconolactonase